MTARTGICQQVLKRVERKSEQRVVILHIARTAVDVDSMRQCRH